MARYTIHLPAMAPREAALERAIFVRDGWSWGAFLLGPFWLFRHRHWGGGMLALIATLALLAGIALLPIPAGARLLAVLALQVLFALEGSSLRRAALRAAGFEEAGLVAGQNRDEIEYRFFAGALPGGDADAGPLPPPAAPVPGAMPSPVLGLFPEARKHP
jgi:hypothetical protein